jgi:hypothetical protein
MKTVLLILAAFFGAINGPLRAQGTPPAYDGNFLLDECSAYIRVADSPSLTKTSALDKAKFMWCEGYLRATLEYSVEQKMRLAVLGAAGLRFSGPDKVQENALKVLDPVCSPENISILQMARVILKWLQNHPERLHEAESLLVRDALESAFPCTSRDPLLFKERRGSGDQKPQ